MLSGARQGTCSWSFVIVIYINGIAHIPDTRLSVFLDNTILSPSVLFLPLWSRGHP
jgi:hypothetical protein